MIRADHCEVDQRLQLLAHARGESLTGRCRRAGERLSVWDLMTPQRDSPAFIRRGDKVDFVALLGFKQTRQRPHHKTFCRPHQIHHLVSAWNNVAGCRQKRLRNL